MGKHRKHNADDKAEEGKVPSLPLNAVPPASPRGEQSPRQLSPSTSPGLSPDGSMASPCAYSTLQLNPFQHLLNSHFLRIVETFTPYYEFLLLFFLFTSSSGQGCFSSKA